MADITDLLEHAGQVRPPALVELEQVAAHRRRRAAAAAATSAVAAVVVTLVLAMQPFGQRDASPAPVAPKPSTSQSQDPTPSIPPPDLTRGPFPELTPEEVRNHPDAFAERNDIPVTAAPGVAARLWSVCLADCSRETTYQDGEQQRALEVTRDDYQSSALYRYAPPEPNVSHALDDWFVMSSIADGFLVNSRGERRPLSLGSAAPVADVAGPLVYATAGLAYVDLETLELHELEGAGYWDWWGAEDTWFWGNVWLTDEAGEVLRQGLTWRNPDGTFAVRMLPIDYSGHSTQMLRSGIPGTMAAIDPGPPHLLHVSTDYGATWDVREMPRSWGTGTGTSLPDDWKSWTEVWRSWPTP